MHEPIACAADVGKLHTHVFDGMGDIYPVVSGDSTTYGECTELAPETRPFALPQPHTGAVLSLASRPTSMESVVRELCLIRVLTCGTPVHARARRDRG